MYTRKNKTVKSLCTAFTSELAAVAKQQTEIETETRKEVKVLQARADAAHTEAAQANKAISNIKKLFGVK